MYDTVTPRFRQRVAQGEVIFNPMYSFSADYSSAVGTGAMAKANSSFDCSGTARYHESRWEASLIPYFARTYRGHPSLPPELYAVSQDDIEDAKVEVSTRVLAQRHRSDSDIWEALAEIEKTKVMIADLLKRITTMAARPGSATRKISSDWLLFRYGIMPLIRDIEAVLAGLKRTTGRIRKTTRAFASLQSSTSTSFSGYYGIWQCTVAVTCNDIVQVRGMSLDDCDAGILFNMGFSAKGLASLPWELIHYSHVVDWFLSLGDYLQSMIPNLSFDEKGSALVVKRERTTTCQAVSTTLTSSSYTLTRPFSGSVSSNVQETTRGCLYQPGVVVRSNFRFDNMTRLADAAAHVAQLISNKFAKHH